MAKVKHVWHTLRGMRWLNWLACAVAVFLTPLAFQAMVEFIRMRSVTLWVEYLWIHRVPLLLGTVVLVLAAAAITFATARPFIANLVLGAVLFAAGCANLQKLAYRGEPVIPKDVFQLSEALAISGEMRFSLTREMVLFLVFLVLSTLVLLPFRLPVPRGWKAGVARGALSLLCAGGIPLYMFGLMRDKPRMAELGVYMRINSMAITYYRSTFVTGFCFLAANSWQAPPEDYSQAAMQVLAKEMPAAEGRSPDIIAILLEGFFDLSAIEGTSYSEELMPNFARLAAEGVSGQMLGASRSGGTSNYEFSILTGYSLDFFPPGSTPTIEHVNGEFPSLPWYCAQNGYRTVAVHPYYREFYGRPTAYPAMGIEEYYSIEEFSDADTVGNFIGDDALGRYILQEYEKSAAADENVFIHAVTIQNHLPYPADRYPTGYGVQASSGVSAEYDKILSTYATGIRDCDAMVGMLCDYFAGIDRDVILLFYGDHQSAISDEGMADMLYETAWYQSAGADEQWRMTHVTPYLMWANFETKDAEDGGLLAPYMLVPTMAQAYGLNCAPYFSWMAQQAQSAGGGSVSGYYIQPGGTLSQTPTPAQQAWEQKRELLQYDMIFGRRYAQAAMFGAG
ncbi:LTA synthase family protein [Ruminococcaceae bacterium OttesenSCG-928-O06]|nr:LTA synthase family protein [Ruminococcaceae bacterium OttesenSCG-928-O06]